MTYHKFTNIVYIRNNILPCAVSALADGVLCKRVIYNPPYPQRVRVLQLGRQHLIRKILKAQGAHPALAGGSSDGCIPPISRRRPGAAVNHAGVDLDAGRDVVEDDPAGQGLLHDGANLLLVAFGGGLTWGASVIRWGTGVEGGDA